MNNLEAIFFKEARPVWVYGRELEKNLTLGLRAAFDKPLQNQVILKVTGSSIYRFFINGEFFGCGPARGPHGYYRIDEWDITSSLNEEKNIIAIEVVGYNVNSYYVLDQPSFIQAELSAGEIILAATGIASKSFEAGEIKERMQKVQRYSFQRTFVEIYRLEEGFDQWNKNLSSMTNIVELTEVPPQISSIKYLSRNVDYPEFHVRTPLYVVIQGEFEKLDKAEEYYRDRALINICAEFKGYNENELECCLSKELDELKSTVLNRNIINYSDDELRCIKEDTFNILDFGIDLTGFIGVELECTRNSLLYMTFDEVLIKDDIDYKRNSTVNAVKFELKPGKYRLETMEPYTLRFLKLAAMKGSIKIKKTYIREYAGKGSEKAGFQCSTQELNRIFKAGVESYRQNAVDIFMDCPSRERAGWLCDSFFTSRVEFALTGKSFVEKNFFENFLLPGNFDFLPEGMLPMCYPADHYDGNFIPNWAMWFVLQLDEYLQRSGDREMVHKLREKIYKLLGYFEKFENEHGLLERLEGWIYVDSSESNDLIQDVNYPTNMLYSCVLEIVGNMYEDSRMREKAQKLRGIIIAQAFNGLFFVDNAVRENGILKVTKNMTEACQYYAFFFRIATPEEYPELWNTIVRDFGPGRKKTGFYPEVYGTDTFIGNFLRLEVLSRGGCISKVAEDMKELFTYMEKETGTLWEHDEACASCNHGFASHVIHNLFRDLLGVRKIDTNEKTIEIAIGDSNIMWCEGYLPVEDSRLYVKWKKENDRPVLYFEVPTGYKVKVS